MPFTAKQWLRYSFATLSYGFVRSTTYDYESRKIYLNRKVDELEEKDMLLIDQTGRVLTRTCTAVLLWPVMLGDDLARLECFVRGRNPLEYGIGRRNNHTTN